ncbi:MAG: hypothetical protein ACLTLQ_00830 [[Clostridium] scindens]
MAGDSVSREAQRDYKKIILNPNIIAMPIGGFLFATPRIKFPVVIGEAASAASQRVISPAPACLVIGMVIGGRGSSPGWVFSSRNGLISFISFIRLIAIPALATIAFVLIGRIWLHKDAEYILMVVLLCHRRR